MARLTCIPKVEQHCQPPRAVARLQASAARRAAHVAQLGPRDHAHVHQLVDHLDTVPVRRDARAVAVRIRMAYEAVLEYEVLGLLPTWGARLNTSLSEGHHLIWRGPLWI